MGSAAYSRNEPSGSRRSNCTAHGAGIFTATSAHGERDGAGWLAGGPPRPRLLGEQDGGDRDEDEQDRKPDGEVEQRFLDPASASVDRAIRAEGGRESRPAGLEQDHEDQDDGNQE